MSFYFIVLYQMKTETIFASVSLRLIFKIFGSNFSFSSKNKNEFPILVCPTENIYYVTICWYNYSDFTLGAPVNGRSYLP